MNIWIWTDGFSPWKGPFPHPTNEYLDLGRICSQKVSFSPSHKWIFGLRQMDFLPERTLFPSLSPREVWKSHLGAGVCILDLSRWWGWVLSHCAEENVISSILDLPPLSLIEKSAAACVRSKRGLICTCLFYRQLKHLLLFFCSPQESFPILSTPFRGSFSSAWSHLCSSGLRAF